MNYWPGTSIPISRHNGFDLYEVSPWTEQFCASLRKSETSRSSATQMVNRKHLSFDGDVQASADRTQRIRKGGL